METCIDDAKKPFDPNSLWAKIIFQITHKNWWRIRNQTIGDILDTHIQSVDIAEPIFSEKLQKFDSENFFPPVKKIGINTDHPERIEGYRHKDTRTIKPWEIR